MTAKTEFLDMLTQILQESLGKHRGELTLLDVQYDGDSNSASLVVTTSSDDGHEEWLISSEHVERLADPEELLVWVCPRCNLTRAFPADDAPLCPGSCGAVEMVVVGERSYAEVARDGRFE